MADIVVRASVDLDGEQVSSRTREFTFAKADLGLLNSIKESVELLAWATMVDILFAVENEVNPEGDVVRAVGKIIGPVLGTPVKYGWRDDGQGGQEFFVSAGQQEVARPTVQETIQVVLNQWCANK